MATFNIVLVGKTGNGKSSTANTIFNSEVFKEGDNMNSCTQEVSQHSEKFNLDTLNVFDTPGLADTCHSQLKILDVIKPILENNEHIINAFLLVLRCDSKYTDEEIETLDNLQQYFGPDFIKTCIVVFTYADSIGGGRNEPVPFELWIERQESNVTNLLKKCNNRYIAFYNALNYKNYEAKRSESLEKLMSLIKKHNMSYSIRQFKDVEKSRIKMRVQFAKKHLEEKYNQQINKKTQELNNLKIQSAAELERFELEFQAILKDIETDDQDTSVLLELKKAVQNMIESIFNRIQVKRLQEKYNKIINAKKQDYVALESPNIATIEKYESDCKTILRDIEKDDRDTGELSEMKTLVLHFIGLITKRLQIKRLEEKYLQQIQKKREEYSTLKVPDVSTLEDMELELRNILKDIEKDDENSYELSEAKTEASKMIELVKSSLEVKLLEDKYIELINTKVKQYNESKTQDMPTFQKYESDFVAILNDIEKNVKDKDLQSKLKNEASKMIDLIKHRIKTKRLHDRYVDIVNKKTKDYNSLKTPNLSTILRFESDFKVILTEMEKFDNEIGELDEVKKNATEMINTITKHSQTKSHENKYFEEINTKKKEYNSQKTPSIEMLEKFQSDFEIILKDVDKNETESLALNALKTDACKMIDSIKKRLQRARIEEKYNETLNTKTEEYRLSKNPDISTLEEFETFFKNILDDIQKDEKEIGSLDKYKKSAIKMIDLVKKERIKAEKSKKIKLIETKN